MDQLLPYYLLGISVISLLFAILFKYLIFVSQFKKQYVILEITPPHNSSQTPLATEQFLTILHSLGKQRSWFERIIEKKKRYALEIVSTREKGIRFLIRTTPDEAQIIKKHLLSFLPGVKVASVDEHLPSGFDSSHGKTVSLRLSRHFSLPLQEQKQLTQHDPVAYITGQMTKLEENELIAVQFVLTPATNKNIGGFGRITIFLLNIVAFLFLTPFTLIGWLIFHDNKEPLPLWLFVDKKKENKQPIIEKTDRELFETSIRLHVSQKTQARLKERVTGLITSFAGFRNANQQEFRVKRSLPFVGKIFILEKLFFFQLRHRLLALTQNPVLSAGEVAALFHFPATTTQTEDLITSKSRVLPSPLSLKQKATKFDVLLGNNNYAGTTTSIGLTQDERRRHLYVLGATGMGKTTLLATMIREDIQNGKGVCVIDPHGNLIEQILPAIPKERLKDTVLFDPDDTDFPIGLNLLSVPKVVSDKELQRQKEFITSNLISIIMKLYPPRYTGPRMEYILRNTTLTALETENPTLFTIQRLLVDNAYRKQVVSKLKNPALILFWAKEFEQMGSYQKSEAVSPITNKIGKFITSSLSANILGQKESKLDFSDILDNGKILLCDLSKGKIGEDYSSMFGALVTAGVQLAALKRTRIPEEDRRDFYLYIDEFQSFANSSFAQVMSEARKYRLNAIFAHQTLSQIEDHDLIKVILANTGSIICFRTGSPLDEEFILPFFAPQIEKGEIGNLSPYNFYMKINNDKSQNSFSGETIKSELSSYAKALHEVQEISRTHYVMPKEQIEKEIREEFFTGIPQKKAKKTITKSPKKGLPENASA